MATDSISQTEQMETKPFPKAGVAPIKKEFIIPKENPVGTTENTPKEGDENTSNTSEPSSTVKNEEGSIVKNEEGSTVKNEEASQDGDKDGIPPAKKRKGQNRKRPRTCPKEDDEVRLCPNIVSKQECDYGENCRFSHDVIGYMSTKPPDIGDRCINFELFGKCIYGVQCRFCSKHITGDNFKNVVNEEKYQETLAKGPAVKNTLKKDVQFSLRKKQYTFKKSDSFMISLINKDRSLVGAVTDEDVIRIRSGERKKIDVAGKTYLAPLTTVGNLPFRRICKRYGADITCGEMAMAVNILQGQPSEWALLKRHSTEDLFGVQLCGSFPDSMSRCAELLCRETEIDFIDVNVGCPIDLVFRKGGGSALMRRINKFQEIVEGMVEVADVPITVKLRTGIQQKHWNAHKIIPQLREWGASVVTLHGRSREGRYTNNADWEYINQCAQAASPMPLFGNGDILSYEDVNLRKMETNVAGVMVARGALIKPWIFTEIKEQRHWDISSSERLEILRDFTHFGLEHWGSDTKGVENTRRFLLEWLSFLHRYIPVGILEVLPQRINERPPYYRGRDEMETLMSSRNCADWIKISEMLLGPVPDTFSFIPKHKANSYS